MAAADVDLLKMRHTTIASRDRDVLELHIHVVFGCEKLARKPLENYHENLRTFEELAAIDLAGGDLECDDVSLYTVSAAQGRQKVAVYARLPH
jgi:hypothetical protein